jgi:hypothetical protein
MAGPAQFLLYQARSLLRSGAVPRLRARRLPVILPIDLLNNRATFFVVRAEGPQTTIMAGALVMLLG